MNQAAIFLIGTSKIFEKRFSSESKFMSFDACIKIEDIPGESSDEAHVGCIELAGYSFGMHQSTSATASSAGGASSGRSSLSDFTFTKALDKASCKLIEAVCAGRHLEEVVVSLHRAGKGENHG